MARMVTGSSTPITSAQDFRTAAVQRMGAQMPAPSAGQGVGAGIYRMMTANPQALGGQQYRPTQQALTGSNAMSMYQRARRKKRLVNGVYVDDAGPYG